MLNLAADRPLCRPNPTERTGPQLIRPLDFRGMRSGFRGSCQRKGTGKREAGLLHKAFASSRFFVVHRLVKRANKMVGFCHGNRFLPLS